MREPKPVGEILKPLSKEEFNALTPEEKRVRVAEEVLHLIGWEILRAGTTYMGLGSDPSSIKHSISGFCYHNDIPDTGQAHEVLGKSTTCEACAIGALAYSAILSFNDLELDCELLETDGESLVDVLLKYGFEWEQVALMEVAFESSIAHQIAPVVSPGDDYEEESWDGDDYMDVVITDFEVIDGSLEWDDVHNALTYRERLHRATSQHPDHNRTILLQSIMENIVKNNGTFYPFDIVVPPHLEIPA